MAYEDQRVILIRRVYNRADVVFDIRGSTLAFLAEVVVDDGMIGPDLRLKYGNQFQPEVFDFLEKVLEEEKKRAEFFERICELVRKKFEIPKSILSAVVNEVIDDDELVGSYRKIFEDDLGPEIFDFIEKIHAEELKKISS